MKFTHPDNQMIRDYNAKVRFLNKCSTLHRQELEQIESAQERLHKNVSPPLMKQQYWPENMETLVNPNPDRANRNNNSSISDSRKISSDISDLHAQMDNRIRRLDELQQQFSSLDRMKYH